MVACAAPERAVLLIEINRGDRAGVLFHEFQRVAHPRQFPSHPRRHFVRERHPPRFRLVLTERTSHLIACDVGRLARLLHGHTELDDVEEELQQVLVLRIATLNGKTEEQLAILQRQRRRERDAWSFSRDKDVEWVLGFVENEALHALAHADSGVTRNACRKPATARRDGNRPTFVVSGLNGGRARAEVRLELGLAVR